MIQITTRFFGTLECPEEALIHFPSGIPPFSDQQRFVIVSEEESALVFLQSAVTPELCLITVPIQIIDPAYRLKVEPFDLQALKLEEHPAGLAGLTCLAVLTIPEQGSATANLAAPILINPAHNIGVQAIRADRTYCRSVPRQSRRADDHNDESTSQRRHRYRPHEGTSLTTERLLTIEKQTQRQGHQRDFL